MRALFAKYLKFCVVGGSGVFVDMALIYLLAGLMEWNETLSKVIAAEVAVFNNFLWNDLWTFRGEGDWRARLIRLGKFNLICAAGIGLSVLLLNIQVSALGMNLYLANFISIVIASIWNFLMNWTFSWKTSAAPLPVRASKTPSF